MNGAIVEKFETFSVIEFVLWLEEIYVYSGFSLHDLFEKFNLSCR